MAIRQSVLALYGAITDALNALNRSNTPPEVETPVDPYEARRLRNIAWEVAQLTGSAGERGWYGELLSYFNDHLVGREPVVAPSLEEIQADLLDTANVLPTTWSYNAIAAAYVLDQFSDAGVGRARNLPRFLIPALAASPSAEGDSDGPVRIGVDRAEGLAARLTETRITTQLGFWGQLKALSGTLDTAVAEMQQPIVLRKVKREYCTVATTYSEWPNISYTKLKAVIEPVNWSAFYHEFFCAMTVIGEDDQGWTKIHEEVSGQCDRYRLRTALRFWKANRKDDNGLFINYDMDSDRTGTDKLVLVDNGYIWITPLVQGKPDAGVRVRTSKELLISGMSATALTKLATCLGYATSASDMFYYAAKYKGAAIAFKGSAPKKTPIPDTSPTWPVIVPELPPSLRDEMCRDTTEFIKERFDSAYDIAEKYATDWDDGIDLDEYDELADDIGDEVTESAKKAFEMATDNFRPKPAPQGP